MTTHVCAQKDRDCWGEVALYSFDMDLPTLWLCRGHVWSLFQGVPLYARMQVADELDPYPYVDEG